MSPSFRVCRFFALLLAFFAGTIAFAKDIGPGIPILCYHQVIPHPEGKFMLSTQAFREQMTLLKKSGYCAINGDTLLEVLRDPEPPNRKYVVISFDDGFLNVFTQAFPIMKEFGFVGVACIYPEFIGSGGGMSWSQLKELQAAGWSIECHSMSHADLAKPFASAAAQKSFLEREIVAPKKQIEDHLGHPVHFMVWPYGIYTEEALRIAREAGYTGAMTVDGGANYHGIDPFQVKRQVVYGNDTQEKFTIRLEMGPLAVTEPSPRPGEICSRFSGMKCRLPELADYSPDRYVLNPKVTGGKLDFHFDPQKRELQATLDGTLKRGNHFIDVYLRDRQTGVTSQHGWFFILR